MVLQSSHQIEPRIVETAFNLYSALAQEKDNAAQMLELGLVALISKCLETIKEASTVSSLINTLIQFVQLPLACFRREFIESNIVVKLLDQVLSSNELIESQDLQMNAVRILRYTPPLLNI
jgi:hypothetical protein